MKPEGAVRLRVVPISLSAAHDFVRKHHRHHKPDQGHKFSVSIADEAGKVRGVAIVGRPRARMLDDGLTLEVTRLASDGCPNACSALYRAAWRVAREMGFKKVLTFTLATESGGSLRGAGWICMHRRGRRRLLVAQEQASNRQTPAATQAPLGGLLLMKLLTLAIALTDSKEPPAAFQIFALGETPTSKGTLLFDADAATQVMAAFQAQGNELSIDYEHQSLTDPPVRAPAAAWFALEVRADGLWAVNVRWTPDADAHLRAGEYRYFSPAVELDSDTGRVLRLINLALTNLPATKAMKPLVAAKDQPTQEPSMKTLLTAMGLKDTASEAEALSAFGQLTGRFQQSEQELLLTSAASVNEAFGVIRGLKDAAAQLTKLNTRVQELEQQDREREVEALIGQGKREGKLAPAQEGFFREMGKKDVAILKGFLASAPKLVATAADAAKVPAGEADIVVLSETEKQTAKQLGVSEVDFIASKKTQKAKKN